MLLSQAGGGEKPRPVPTTTLRSYTQHHEAGHKVQIPEELKAGYKCLQKSNSIQREDWRFPLLPDGSGTREIRITVELKAGYKDLQENNSIQREGRRFLLLPDGSGCQELRQRDLQVLFQILTSLPVLRNCKTNAHNQAFANYSTVEALNFVDSKFGPVPFGSLLSYQCPPEISRDIIKHPGAPGFPQLPIEGHNFKFHIQFEPNYKQQCHLESHKVSREISAAIEAETRLQSECQLWTQVRKSRLTASRFGEISHVRGESTAKSLAARILRGSPQTAAMKRGTWSLTY
ncbi:uncharacterized protein LOC143704406 [Siphateles boraxobius]|uniref:uncharacterized protein LOC143704406 n=1 Tax=Siphateles boraxobius TaxID=180520 RepID=UPI004063735B